MKLDITPTIEQADKTDAICIEMREIDALYVVRLANGKAFSTKWSRKEMEEFQPSKTVSEMLQEWEEGILRRYAIAKESLKTGLHPTDTFERKIMIKLTTISCSELYYPSGKTERVRSELDKYQRAHFKREMKDREEEFGKLTLFKIC